METTEARLNALKNELNSLKNELGELKSKKKDWWDKIGISAAALVPIAIFVFTVSSHMSATKATEARQEAEEVRLRAQQLADSKLQQGELVSKFFEPLMGDDPKRSAFAVESLLVAAPHYGPVLVRVVASNASPTADFAKQALTARRDSLLREMFSDDAGQRINAYGQLLSSWGGDEAMVASLVEHGMKNRPNKDGTYNALLLLSQVDKRAVMAHRDEVIEFTKVVENDGPKIAGRAASLRSSLRF